MKRCSPSSPPACSYKVFMGPLYTMERGLGDAFAADERREEGLMIRSLMYGGVAAALVGVLDAPAHQPGQPSQQSASQQPPSQQPAVQQSPAQHPPSQQPTFRAGTDIVRVFVTVTDRDGRLVTTLNRGDFEVRDEGKPQEITTFDNTPRPIRLIAMLDCSGSMSGNLQLLRASAEQLFLRLRRDDGVRVGSVGRDVTISPSFTNDPGQLRTALPESIPPDAPTPLWRAVDEAMTGLRSEGAAEADARPVT